jgi:hypothetical protein
VNGAAEVLAERRMVLCDSGDRLADRAGYGGAGAL